LVRIQQQINENGKNLCHVNVFPEMNHNELVGWMFPAEVYSRSVVFFIESSFNNPRVGLRWKLTQKVFEKYSPSVNVVKAKGDSLLGQIIYLNNLFDWVSYFLSLENGTDAFQIDVINYLKGELAKI